MECSAFRLPVFVLFTLLLCFNNGGTLKLVNADEEKTWCVAKPSSDDATLMGNIKFVCDGLDCSVVNDGGSCFDPDNLMNHASVAMNLYYQTNLRGYGTCNFGNSGLIAKADPSYGECHYLYNQTLM